MGVAHEANVVVADVVVLPDCGFLILRLTRSNLGQTRIIFKPGLTRTKRDPDDPTRFQRCNEWLCRTITLKLSQEAMQRGTRYNSIAAKGWVRCSYFTDDFSSL